MNVEDFEEEQRGLKEKLYYNPSYGDKLMKFYLEMVSESVIPTDSKDNKKNPYLPF